MGRIIAGEKRGLKLYTLEGDMTRPTADRCKEALFNRLRPDIPDACFLDLYAGSGQIGLEALSRGARTAIFAEKERRAAEVVRRNIEKAGYATRSRLLATDVRAALKKLAGEGLSFDLIFMDPPYREAMHCIPRVFRLILENGLLNGEGLMITETSSAESFEFSAKISRQFPALRLRNSCPYGAALLCFWELSEDLSQENFAREFGQDK